MDRTRATVLRVIVALAVGSALAISAAPGQALRSTSTDGASGCARGVDQLENTGFEEPAIPAGGLQFLTQANVPGWWTSASDFIIELWSAGREGVPAAEGSQFAELNANMASALSQDIVTTPGTVLTWGLSHRGRSGTDTMRVLIGAPGDDLVNVAQFSDGNVAWGRHSGTYTVPAGQTCTRFQFEAVSAAGGPTVGNFLDAISFGTPAELQASSSVSPTGMVSVGQALTFSVPVSNVGGSASLNAVVSDTLPSHTTFVPGSITITYGSTIIPINDSAYDAETHTITVQLIGAAGVGGVIAPGETVTLSFQATIDAAAAGTMLRNDAAVTGTDARGVQTSTGLDPVYVTARPNADVQLEATATVAAHPGDTVHYTLTVTNTGPMAALLGDGGEPAAQVVATLPLGITPDASSLPTECSIAAQAVTCDRMTTLSAYTGNPATQWSLAFTGTVANDSPLGVRALTATVTTQTNDDTLGNNSTSANTTVALPTPAALAVVTAVSTPVVRAGENGSLTITMTNTGELPSSSTALTESVPAGFTPTTIETDSGTCTTTTSISCGLGIILGGQTVTVTITGSTDASLADGTVLDHVASASDGTTSAGDTGTMTIDAASLLLVTKTMTTGTAIAGAPVGYTVSIQNLGPSIARNARIDDELPTGTALVAVPDGCTLTGAHLTCMLGTLAVSQAVTISYSLSTAPGGGVLVNTATGTSDSTAINASQSTAQTNTALQAQTNLSITQTASSYTIASGDTVTLTFTVTNSGPSTATNVVVQNTVPTGLTYLNDGAATVSPDGTNPLTPGAVTLWDIGTLAPGTTVTATIHARVVGGPGAYPNSVTVSADAADENPLNDSAVATLVIPSPTTTTTLDATAVQTTVASPAAAQASTTSAAGVSGLARTGASALPIVGTGAAFTSVGALLVAGSRRRRGIRR